jgi:hypothetical protein
MVSGGIRAAGDSVADDHAGNAEAGGAVGFWTAINIARLKILWADGYSATRISAEIGCTRNAAIGKLYRLKLPQPLIKKSIKDGTYTKQLTPEQRENRRLRVQRCRQRAREMRRQDYLKQQRDAIWLADSKEDTRKEFLANGASPHSAAYRKHMRRVPELTKGELREMLKLAVQNTAAMQ